MENSESTNSGEKRKRYRQIVSCKSCKSKRVKCEQETDPAIINSLNYKVNDESKHPCKRCISKNMQCEYFEKIIPPSKKKIAKRPYHRKKSNTEASDVSNTVLAGTPSILGSQMNNDSQNNINVPNYISSIKQTMSFAPFNNAPLENRTTLNTIPSIGLPSVGDLQNNTSALNSNISHFSSEATTAINNKGKSNNPLNDLANIVADDVKNNGLGSGIGNKTTHTKISAYTSPNMGPMMSNITGPFMNQVFFPKNSPMTERILTSNTANKNNSIFGNIKRAPSIAGSPNNLNFLPRLQNFPTNSFMCNEKPFSPMESNHALKASNHMSPETIVSQKGKGMFMNSPRPLEGTMHPLKNLTPGSTNIIGLEHIKNNIVTKPSPTFKEKYYTTPLNDGTMVENPIRKLDMHHIHNESVFTCSAISVRPWFEESKLVQKHKVLFDHLQEKSQEQRNKQNDHGIGNIKKDRLLILTSLGQSDQSGNIWDRIVQILPPMDDFRECIKTFFNSNLHMHVRVVDRISIFKTLDKYFEVETVTHEITDDNMTNASKTTYEVIKKIKLDQADNFFNVGIVLQIYRIVMGKNITEKEDDLFRLMEIFLNGLSSGFIWSFTKLQFSIFCYLQRHLDLTMSDFGFNFKVISEQIASTCLKIGLNKGLKNFFGKECDLPEWILKNLYMWSMYFDMMHALEAGCALVIPYDPIIEAVELNDSERGRDGLLRRFIFLGRKIINALYEPYGVPDFDGMLAKIKEFENLEFISLDNYCNISTVDNIDIFDYSVLEPLMDLKLTINMLKHLTSNRSLMNIDFAYFFGFTFASLAITIVMREKWQNSLDRKEMVLSAKGEVKKLNVNHLSYFHSLAVQRDLIDKIGITFYEMLYRFTEYEGFMNFRSVEEQNIYTHDDILSHMISLVLLEKNLPLDLEYNAKDLLKSFTSITERFYNVDMFGEDKQPQIHFREFETIFRNIYIYSLNNLESGTTPKPASVSGEVREEGAINVPNQESEGPIWNSKYSQIELENEAEEMENPMQQIWSEEDLNALQLFDVDFTTFLTPFL